MASNWFYELNERIGMALNKEMTAIASGSCTSPDHSADKVAMEYNQRIGFVQGLSAALQIAQDMEKGTPPER